MPVQGYSQTRRVLAVVSLAGILLTWAAAAGWLWHDRHQTLSTAEDQLRRLSVITAEQTYRLFSLADVFLDSLEKVLATETADWANSPALVEHITRFHGQMNGAANVGLVDASGIVRLLSGTLARQSTSVADRDYVRNAQIGRMSVTAPVKGRLSGEWVIPLVRRVEAPVEGVAVMFVSLHVPALEKLYDSIRAGPSGGMALVRGDGMLLARAPHREDLMGRVFAGPLFREQLPKAPEGVFVDISAIDGTLRMVAYRTVQPYGLVLTVSAAMEQILAPWWKHLWWVGLGALAISAMILGGFALTWRLLRQLEDNARYLDRRVRERTADLERAMEARSKFLASMSHELRTPLNAILGFSDALKSGAFGTLADHHADYVKDIHTSGALLLALVNDLLDTAALDAGKLTLDEAEIDPGGIVTEATGMIQRRADEAGVRLDVKIGPGMVRVFADRRRVLQAVLNIVTNAVKYHRPGGWVKIVCGLVAGGDYTVTVIDNGPGMSRESLSLAMTPFGRADDPTTRTIEGAGLGLPLAASLMEIHGGSLDIDSVAGQGTTVRLRLPAGRVRPPKKD